MKTQRRKNCASVLGYVYSNSMEKKQLNRAVLILLFWVVGCNVYAQSKQTLLGDMLLERGHYLSAVKAYEEALKEDKKHEYVFMKMAECYNSLFLGDSALKYTHLAMALVKYPTLYMYKNKAKALQTLYQFDDAIKHYNKADPRKMDPEINKCLRECENGKAYLKRPVKVDIQNIGDKVNTPHHDLLPKITADGKYLFFASYPSEKEVNSNNMQDVFRSVWNGSEWGIPEKVPAPISDMQNNDAVVGLSPDGHTMFIFRGSNGGDILMSELIGGEWQTPVEMHFNTAHKESSITISPDGKTLLFVRKSKMGNGNIYECKKQEDGSWSTPVLLGKNINSPYDEESPFLHPDGKTLYFSSKGHATMGGYDIFKSTLKDGEWQAPVSVGFPVNTTSDDFCFVLSADGKKGFYSSQRLDGFGGQDIYMLTFKGEQKMPELTLLQGVVHDAQTKLPVEATITIINNETNKEVATFRSNAQTGEYLVSLPAGKNYGITIEDSNYLFRSENVYLPLGEGYQSIEKNIGLIRVQKGNKIRLNNVFFETGSANLSPASYSELDRVVLLLNQQSSINIEIEGHTDNVGSDEANKQLSQQRAEVVKQYLVSKGIIANRLQAKGYGSAQPVGDNTTETGRSLNRRTELKILE